MEVQEAPATVGSLDIARIMEMIPHRYPFLMIDRVVDLVPGASAIGIKNVTINEPHFQGHFPRRAVMPGVLIIEAMAQTAAVLVVHTLGSDAEGKLVYFMTVDGAGSAARWCPATSCTSTSRRSATAATSGSPRARRRSTACSWPRRLTGR